jgi:hypothetical protein
VSGNAARPGILLRHRVLLAALAVLFAAKLVVVLAGANRGFDIGDDGVFLLSLNDPANAPPLFEFYRLLSHFDPPLRFDVLGIRLLRVAVEVVATLALAHAVFVWARRRFAAVAEAGFAPFLLVALLGALLSVGARGFGYNDATNFVVFLGCACWFRLLAVPGAARAALAWAAAAGFAIGFQLFVKFPPALLLLATAAIGVAWLPRASVRAKLAIAAAGGAGVAAAAGCFVLANGGVAPLLARWDAAQELNRVAGYGVREILWVYYLNDYASHMAALWLWGSFGAVFGFAWWWWRRPDALDRALTVALIAGAAVLAWRAARLHAVNVHPTLIFLFCLLLFLAPVTWALSLRRWRPPPSSPAIRRDEAFAPLLLLAALPFVEIVGSNVALTLKLPAHAAPIFLLLAITLAQLAQTGWRRFAATALGLLIAITSAVFVVHQVFLPYGLPSPLYRQVYETRLLPGLRVDAATRKFLEDVDDRLTEAGFAPGDPVIALDFMPGLVYAVGGRSPGLPFFHFEKTAQNCWAIERAGRGALPFLLLGQDMSLAQHDCIHAFAFPEQFRFVGAVQNPYETAMRYFFAAPPMPYVRVFAPLRDAAK